MSLEQAIAYIEDDELPFREQGPEMLAMLSN